MTLLSIAGPGCGLQGQRSRQADAADAMACGPSMLTSAPSVAEGSYSPMTGRTIVVPDGCGKRSALDLRRGVRTPPYTLDRCRDVPYFSPVAVFISPSRLRDEIKREAGTGDTKSGAAPQRCVETTFALKHWPDGPPGRRGACARVCPVRAESREAANSRRDCPVRSLVHEPEDLPRPGIDPRLTWTFRGEARSCLRRCRGRGVRVRGKTGAPEGAKVVRSAAGGAVPSFLHSHESRTHAWLLSPLSAFRASARNAN
jgi:hypothetical protein